MEESRERSRWSFRNHECVRPLGKSGYAENSRFDAEECTAHLINLVYPWIDNIKNPDLNEVPENCLFCIGGGNSVLCFNCNKPCNELYRTALCQFEFPEPDVQMSVQLKKENMTMDEYRNVMDEKYQRIGRLSCGGPYKFTIVHLSVCPSVSSAFFSGMAH